MSDKKCKKLGNRATRAEREEAHRVKMEMKTLKNEQNHQDVSSRRSHNFANQSIHSEHYGETPIEQARRMAKKSS